MPVGSDFTCQNALCPWLGKMMRMHGPWDIGKIDDVICSKFYVDHLDQQKQLIRKKHEGRTFACIPSPNVDHVKVIGVRLQFFCPRCRIVWDEDIIRPQGVFEREEKLIVTTMNSTGQPCRACGSYCISYPMALKDGLDCPQCGKKTAASEWFGEEFEPDKIDDKKLEEVYDRSKRIERELNS